MKMTNISKVMTIEYNIPLQLGCHYIIEENNYYFSLALGYAGMLIPEIIVQCISVSKFMKQLSI